MEKYCKNCGAKVELDEEYCHDCGAKIDPNALRCKNCGQIIDRNAKFCNNCGHPTKDPHNFCPNCGSKLSGDEDFCSECGFNMGNPVKESFISKHQTGLIAVGAILCILIVLIGAISIFSGSFQEVGEQQVEVGSTNFIIPDNYLIEPSTIDVDYNYGSAIFSKGWGNDNGDAIYITTMLVPYNVDADEVLTSQGGEYMSLMGQSGYYTEDEDIYNFAFESGDYLCIVSVSDPQIFDDITCLG